MMPSIPVLAYVAGFLLALLYCLLFFFSSKIEKKFFSSRITRKTSIFFLRIMSFFISLIRHFRDVFFVRLIEEGIIEGLLLEGTASVFSALGKTPLHSLDGNVNWYIIVLVASVVLFLLFL